MTFFLFFNVFQLIVKYIWIQINQHKNLTYEIKQKTWNVVLCVQYNILKIRQGGVKTLFSCIVGNVGFHGICANLGF